MRVFLPPEIKRAYGGDRRIGCTAPRIPSPREAGRGPGSTAIELGKAVARNRPSPSPCEAGRGLGRGVFLVATKALLSPALSSLWGGEGEVTAERGAKFLNSMAGGTESRQGRKSFARTIGLI